MLWLFQNEQKCLQRSNDGEIFHSVLLRHNKKKKKKPPGKVELYIILELHSVASYLVLYCLLKEEMGFCK